MDDLHAKFLPQFVELARVRVATAVKAVSERDPAVMPGSLPW